MNKDQPLLILDLSKAWSPEARAAAAEARRKGGGASAGGANPERERLKAEDTLSGSDRVLARKEMRNIKAEFESHPDHKAYRAGFDALEAKYKEASDKASEAAEAEAKVMGREYVDYGALGRQPALKKIGKELKDYEEAAKKKYPALEKLSNDFSLIGQGLVYDKRGNVVDATQGFGLWGGLQDKD